MVTKNLAIDQEVCFGVEVLLFDNSLVYSMYSIYMQDIVFHDGPFFSVIHALHGADFGRTLKTREYRKGTDI
jgi:hypothetical protein